MIVYKDELYVAGFFSHITGYETHNIVKWDGEQWIAIGKGIYGQGIADLFIYRDELWVVGAFDSVNNLAMNNVAIWNGEYWCSPGGYFGFEVMEAGEFRDTLYVGGNFREIDGDPVKKYLVKYNPAAPRFCGPPVENIPLGKTKSVQNNAEYQVFPNPVTDILYIALQGHHMNEIQITITDLYGKEFFNEYFKDLIGKKEIALDINNCATGINILKITEINSGKSTIHKYIKSN